LQETLNAFILVGLTKDSHFIRSKKFLWSYYAGNKK